jgi:hypothetical protein
MPRFLPTVWPGTVLPQPPVGRPTAVRVHPGGWLELVGSTTAIDLPVNFYLWEMARERPQTADAAAAFVEQWGRAADVDSRDLPGGEQWWKAPVEQPLLDGDLRLSTSGPGQDRSPLAADLACSRMDLVHVAEVIERARLLSLCTEHARALQAGQDVGLVEWEVFMEVFNAALSAFQVNIVVEGEDRPYALPCVTAYSVAALQLYNDIATKAVYRACASETCTKTFTTQRGTGKYYRRTTGTKYCSNGCARAQAERERRRRQRRDIAS